MKSNKQFSTVIIMCTCIMAFSIIFGCVYIGNSMKVDNKISQVKDDQSEEKRLISIEDAAEYLGLTLVDMKRVIYNQDLWRNGKNSYPEVEYIPYMIIEKKKYFTRDSLDKWIEHEVIFHDEITFQ